MAPISNPSINCLFAIVLIIFSVTISTNALQCYVCGQYNDGVGSITPCLNYSANLAHLHLKECPRKTDKFCIVSDFFPCIFSLRMRIMSKKKNLLLKCIITPHHQ